MGDRRFAFAHRMELIFNGELRAKLKVIAGLERTH
jgi:hypothetical protein